jgi:hypothetical protein
VNLSVQVTNGTRVLRFLDHGQLLSEVIVHPKSVSVKTPASEMLLYSSTTNRDSQKFEVSEWRYKGAFLYGEEYSETNRAGTLRQFGPSRVAIICK